MNKLNLALSLLASAFAFTLAACTEPDMGTASSRVIIDQPCAADTDCPAGFECEIEDEHGVVTSFCQSDDEHSDGTCPAGYELEVEHGQSYCQPHGGDDGSGSGSGSDDGTGSGSGSGSDDGSGSGSGSGSDDGTGSGSGSGSDDHGGN